LSKSVKFKIKTSGWKCQKARKQGSRKQKAYLKSNQEENQTLFSLFSCQTIQPNNSKHWLKPKSFWHWNSSRVECQQGSKQFNNPDIRERLWCLKRVRINIETVKVTKWNSFFFWNGKTDWKIKTKSKLKQKKSKLKLKMTEKKANKGLNWQNWLQIHQEANHKPELTG